MPMPARRRNQRGEAVEQFQRRQHQADAAAGTGLDALVDQMLGIDFAQPLQCKRRPGAVAQQTFQAGAVMGLDAHLGVDRETCVMCPLGHGLDIVLAQQSPAMRRPQHAPAYRRLHRRDGRCVETAGLVEHHRSAGVGLKHTLDDDAVKVEMRVEQGAKTVDEDDASQAGLCVGARTGLPQSPLDGAQKEVQRGVQECWVVFQVITQPFGHRQHPLPHRQARNDVQGEMGGGFDHAPGGAGRTEEHRTGHDAIQNDIVREMNAIHASWSANPITGSLAYKDQIPIQTSKWLKDTYDLVDSINQQYGSDPATRNQKLKALMTPGDKEYIGAGSKFANDRKPDIIAGQAEAAKKAVAAPFAAAPKIPVEITQDTGKLQTWMISNSEALFASGWKVQAVNPKGEFVRGFTVPVEAQQQLLGKNANATSVYKLQMQYRSLMQAGKAAEAANVKLKLDELKK